MLRYFLIFFLFLTASISNDEIKDNIIQNLKNTYNLNFKFEQNINGKIENGNCTIEYPKKIFCEYARSNNKILIYPNPFTEKTIINTLNKSNIKEVSIFDNSGRLIFNNHYNDNIVEIKKGNLEKGTYLLIIETNNYISRNKIIIE